MEYKDQVRAATLISKLSDGREIAMIYDYQHRDACTCGHIDTCGTGYARVYRGMRHYADDAIAGLYALLGISPEAVETAELGPID